MNSAQKIILQASRFLTSRVSFTKTVAITTVVAFMVSSVIGPAAYAANTPVPGVAQTIKESLSAFQLPYSLGRVTDAKYLGSQKVVVAIQDLHCHPEVQRNISSILGILDDKYGKQQQFKVLVEGGMGPIDTSWLNKIADPKVRASAVEALMDAGRLTGAEYYAIQTKKYGLLQGLEDEKPYFENLARLTQIMDTRGDFAGRIGEFKAALAEVTNLYYTAGNRRLDKIAAKREARTLDTEKYYKILLKLAARERIALYDFPATTNFLEVMDQQRRLSYTAVNKQLSKFLETLKEKLPPNVYNQLVEKASRPNGIEDVYVTLAKAAPGMEISQYPELAKFFRFVEKNQKMNPIDLVKEERALLGELRGRLSRSRAEREVAFLADFLQYLQGYYQNRMSADEYEYFTDHAQAFYELWGRYADARLLPSLNQYQDLFGKFYKTNIDRNRIFMEKIGAGDSAPASQNAAVSVEENIFLMSTQLSQTEPGAEVSVVVTGGFHTQGLAKMLEEKGISYVVITPSVTGGTEFAQRMYDLFARELSGQAVAQGKISRAISSRPANFAIDSYGLWLAASSDASLSADALVSKARNMGLQSAVVQLAVQGMTAAQIVNKLNEQNNAEKLKTLLDGLGYKGHERLDITAEGESVVFRDQNNKFALSVSLTGDVSVALKTSSGNVKAHDGLSADLRKTIETLLGTSVGESDVVYFSGLYDQFNKPQQNSELRMGSDTEEFNASALLSNTGRQTELGGKELDDLKANAKKYFERARSVVLRLNPMNGGIGSSVGRKSYLGKIWSFLKRTGEAILGAKASDLFIDVTLNGQKFKVSISEGKLLRALKESSLYQHMIIQQFASTESIESINLLLDTPNIYYRAGLTSEYNDMTYRQILNHRGNNASYGETVVQQALPTIAQGKLSGLHRAPGGHGQLGVYTLLDALDCVLPAEGTLISAIYNEDGINNTVDPLMVGWMADEGIPLVMVSTTKTSIDKKGGLIGIIRTLKGVKTAIMELAQAQAAGQADEFAEMGLTKGQRDAQYFNTNTVLANISVLQPFLRDLVEVIGYDEFVKIISPTLIKNTKNKGKADEYIQLEGALGSVMLNLDGFLSTTDNAQVKAVMEKHNITKLVRILNVSKEDRTKYFTPVKTAFDYWLQFHSDLFTMNVETWELEANRPGFIPEVSLSDAYYADVQNVLDAFGSASTVGLDALKITGKVLLKDAVLKGKVVINNASSDVVDLNDPRWGLRKDADGRLLLENVVISIAADGTVTEVLSPIGGAPSVSPASGSAGIQLTHFENIRWVRYLESMGVPAPIIRGLISIVEMPRFFTISIPNKHSFLAGQLWGLAAVVAVGLALAFLFMPVAPVLSAVAMTSAQFVTAVQSISLALLMIARPRMKSRGEMKGFVAAHQVGQVVMLPKITRLRTPGTSIINGVDIVESKDAVELIDMIIDESIDTLRAATLNTKINLVLDQLESKLQTNASDPFTINSTIDLYGQLVAAVKENDDGIDAAVDAIMPSFTVKKRLTAVWMGATVILGLVTGIPLNMFFVQYLVYSFAFLKALPIISNLYQHSRFNRNSTGIVFTAGPARPGRGSSLPVDRQVPEDIGVKIGLPGMQLKRLWDAVEDLRAGQVDDLRQAIPDLFKAAAEVDPSGEFNLISDITKLRDALNNRDGINDTGRQELIETLENKLWAVISLQFWPLMSTRLENAFLARNEQLGLLSKLFHNQAAAIFTIEDANSALEKRKEFLEAALVRAKDDFSRAQSGNNIRANIVKTIVENNLNRVLDALVRIESMTDQDRDQVLDLVVERAPQEFVAIVLENLAQSVPGNNIPGVSVLRLVQSNLDQATGELELLRSISLMFAESDRQLDAVVLSLAEMHRWYNLSSTLLFDMGKVLASTTWRSFTPSGFSSLVLPNNQERVEQWRAAGVPEFVIGLRVGALELLQTLNPRFVRKHYTRVATVEEMNDLKAGTSLPAGVVTPGSVAARYAGQAVILGAMAAATVSTMALFGFNIGILSSMVAVAAGIAGNIVTHAVYNVLMPHAPLTLDGGAATADAEHGVNAALSETMGTGFDPILSAVTAMPVKAQDRRIVLAMIQELVTQERLRPGPMAGNMHTYVLSSEPGKQTHYDNPLELFQGILALSKLSQKQRSKIANAFMQAAIQSDQRTQTVFTHIFSQFDKMQERQLEAGARLEQLEYKELHQRALAALATIALRHASGEIDPDVSIRASQDVAEIAPVAREVKVGIYPLAGNPMHWAHILIPFEAIAAAGLDKVIFVLSGPDERKPILSATAKYRFKMATAFVNNVFDGFAQVSPIAREINDGADGETNIFRVLDLNPRQKINVFYMVGEDHYAVTVVKDGVETPDTIGKLLTNLASYRDPRSPGYNSGRKNHVVSAIFIERGTEPDREKMDPAIARDEAARRNMSFDVRFLEGFETDMSSSRIRKALRDGDVPALSILPYKKFRYIQKNPMFQLMITGLPVDGEEYSFEGLVDVQDHREISAFVTADGKRVFVTEAPRAGKAGKKTAPGIEQAATPDRQIEVNGQEFYMYDEASFESAISARQAILDERQGGLLNQSLTGNDVALTLRWTKKYVATPLDRWLTNKGIPEVRRQWIVDIAVGVVEYPISLLGPLFGIMHFKKGDTVKDRIGLVFGGTALLAVALAVMSSFGLIVTPASFFVTWGANAIAHVILNRLFRQAGMRELTMGLDDDYRGLDDADDEYDRLLQLLRRLPTRKAEIVQELAQRSAKAASYLAGVRISAEDIDTVRLAAIARIEKQLADTPEAVHGDIDRYNMRRLLLTRQHTRLQTLSVRGSDVSQEHIRTLLQLAPVELLDQVLATNTIPEMHAKRIRNEQEIYSLLSQEFAMLDEIFISLQEPGWFEKIDTPIHQGRPTLRKFHANLLSLQRLYKDHQPGIDGLRPAQALYTDTERLAPEPQQMKRSLSIETLAFPSWAVMLHPFIVPQTLTVAVGAFLKNPIDYTVLGKGVHAVVVPRTTFEILNRAIMRATLTGATVVIVGSIDASEQSDYRPINGSDYLFREITDMSRGKVVEIVFVRETETDDLLMKDALTIVDTFSGDQIVCAQVDPALAAITDFRNGLRVSVLELGYRNPDTVIFNTFMSHMVTKPVVVMAVDARGEYGDIDTDGELWPAQTQADFVAQMHWLDDRTLYKNTTYVQPVSAVAAISPNQIVQASDAVAMITDDRAMANLKHGNIDTLFLDVAPEAWQDAAVLLQLRRLIDKLSTNGIRVGFYENIDGKGSRSLGRYNAMGQIAGKRNGDEVILYLRTAQQNVHVRDIQRLASRSIPGVKMLLEDPSGIRDLSAAPGAAGSSYLLASEQILLNTSPVKLENSMRNARMVILDAPVTRQVQSDGIQHETSEIKDRWQGLFAAFRQNMERTPSFAMAQGRSDARRAEIRPVYRRSFKDVEVAIEQALGDPKAADALHEAMRPGATEDGMIANARNLPAGIWGDDVLNQQNPVMDAAYRIGFVGGIIESIFAREDIIVDGSPVILSPTVRQQYASARMRQWLLRVADQPANPLQDLEMINGIDDQDNLPNYRTDIPGLPRMTVHDATIGAQRMVDVLARIARSSSDENQQRYALAGIIELLRLYGDRDIPENLIEQTNDVVKTELIRTLLGAA